MKQTKYHLHGKNIDLTGDNVTISSNKFNVDANGNMTCNDATINGVVNATSGSFNGTVTATSGTFDNCTVRDNCSVAGNSIASSSSDRIAILYVSSLHSVTTTSDFFATSNDLGSYQVGNYIGQTVNIPVLTSLTVNSSGQVTAQVWKRLVFRGGILVEVQDNW